MSEKSNKEQEKQETLFIPVTVENNLCLALLYRKPTGSEHLLLLRKLENSNTIMDAVKRADSKVGEMYEKSRDLSFQLVQLLRDNKEKP